MSAALITWLSLMVIVLLLVAHEHGKPRTGKHNFWAALLSVVLYTTLFLWGAK